MAVKQPIKTTTNTNSHQREPQKPILPPPQTFDILPPLHELLARVDAYNNNSAISTSLHDEEHDEDIGSAYSELQPLNPKDFPTAALDIKARVRAALREIEKLPDVDRSIYEQQEEILELEEKVQKQRAMLKGLSEVAKEMEGKIGHG